MAERYEGWISKWYLRNHSGSSPEFWEGRWANARIGSDQLDLQADLMLIRRIRKYVSPGALILEGGCGAGSYVAKLRILGFRVVGVDYAVRTIKRLHTAAEEMNLAVANIINLPFENDSFDGYYSGGVIEHFEGGLSKQIGEAFRVLKPGGYFFVTVPHLNKVRFLSALFLGNRSKIDLDGQEIFIRDRLRSIAVECSPAGGYNFYLYVLPTYVMRTELSRAGFVVCDEMPFSSRWGLLDVTFYRSLCGVDAPARHFGHRIVGAALRVIDWIEQNPHPVASVLSGFIGSLLGNLKLYVARKPCIKSTLNTEKHADMNKDSKPLQFRSQAGGLSIAVGIPTYNRGWILLDTLRQVVHQIPPPDEIIVVDQSDYYPPDFRENLSRFLRDNNIRHFFQPFPNLPRARNRILRESRADIVIFIDDDVILSPRFVECHRLNYQGGDDLGGVAGRVTPWIRPRLSASIRKMSIVLDYRIFDISGNERVEYVGTFAGCNHSVRKSAAMAVGGYDEAFAGVALREETDMAIRLIDSGWRIAFDPLASLHHLAAPTGGCRVRIWGNMSAASCVLRFAFKHRKKLGRYWWWELWHAYRLGVANRFNVRHPLRMIQCHYAYVRSVIMNMHHGLYNSHQVEYR